MTIMQESDTIKVFKESLKQAASLTRELNTFFMAKSLESLAYQIDQTRINGVKLWESKQLDKSAKEAILANRESSIATDGT